MNTYLFRSGSVLVQISLVPYKYVPINMCIGRDNRSNPIEEKRHSAHFLPKVSFSDVRLVRIILTDEGIQMRSY